MLGEESKYEHTRDESAYLDLVRKVLQQGSYKADRTGVGTLSLFGETMTFDLRGGILPLLTTKAMNFNAIAEELSWFLRGETNANTLSERGVKIWNANGSRQFLDSRGLKHREVGDLGPIYGFQWRHFGAKYTDMYADYTGQGVDQLAELIQEILNNPNSRRMILTAWNPTDLAQMALPPCHMTSQFSVNSRAEDVYLDCLLFQRSGDLGLGVPYNIASYGLLTHALARVCNLKAGTLTHVIGEAHVYQNHIEPLKEQLKRAPKPPPRIGLVDWDPLAKPTLAERLKYLENLSQHARVNAYYPYPPIRMEMAV